MSDKLHFLISFCVWRGWDEKCWKGDITMRWEDLCIISIQQLIFKNARGRAVGGGENWVRDGWDDEQWKRDISITVYTHVRCVHSACHSFQIISIYRKSIGYRLQRFWNFTTSRQSCQSLVGISWNIIFHSRWRHVIVFITIDWPWVIESLIQLICSITQINLGIKHHCL